MSLHEELDYELGSAFDIKQETKDHFIISSSRRKTKPVDQLIGQLLCSKDRWVVIDMTDPIEKTKYPFYTPSDALEAFLILKTEILRVRMVRDTEHAPRNLLAVLLMDLEKLRQHQLTKLLRAES